MLLLENFPSILSSIMGGTWRVSLGFGGTEGRGKELYREEFVFTTNEMI